MAPATATPPKAPGIQWWIIRKTNTIIVRRRESSRLLLSAQFALVLKPITMKLTVPLFLLCSTLTGTAFTPVQAAPQALQAPITPTSINVKDYGAKGDGIADDTQAIQHAVNAAADQAKRWQYRIQHWRHLIRGAVDNPRSEVVFPAGTYKISRPVVFGRFNSLRGIGKTVIHQTDSTQDSFYFHGVQQAFVEGFTFEGGKTQLRFWTNNLGIALLSVQDNHFINSSSYAIECRSFTQQVLGLDDTKPWAPYEVAWKDGQPTLTPNEPVRLRPWFNSTVTVIERNKFENVMHAVDLSGDTGLIRDCEVITNPEMEGAVFRVEDLIHLHRIKGMARPNPGKQQYWIESAENKMPATFYAAITLRDSVLDSESANGIGIVRSDLLPYGTSIVLDNSRVKTAGSLVTIAKGTQPNIISINGVTEISGRPVKAVTWEEVPDAITLEAIKDQPKYARSPDIYKIQIDGNSPNIDTTAPDIFAPLLLPPVPQAALKETYLPELSWRYADLETEALKNGKVIFASGFGLDNDPSTDDTAAVQQAFEAAGKAGNTLLVFPAGIFKLSDTVQLPANVAVRAAGTTAFILDGNEKDLFSAKNATNLAFKGFSFNGGRNAMNIANDNNLKARIAFENCSFYDQFENGVKALTGKGETGERNQTELSIQGGWHGNMHGLTTNAARTQLTAMTLVNDPHLDNASYIKNLGGQMRLDAVLTNPKLWQGKRSEGKLPEGVTSWDYSKNTCWIENWGQIYSRDTRWGGETGGMCNIVNRSAAGTIYIGGGNARFHNGLTHKTLVLLETMPRRVVVQNVGGPAAKIEDAWTIMNADGSDGKNEPNIIVSSVPTP